MKNAQTLNSCFFADCQLASVVSTGAAYGVVNMPLTAIGANSERRSYCLVMGSSLCSSCVRLSSFRMCHFYLILNSYYNFSFFNSFQRGSMGFSSAAPSASIASSLSSISSSMLSVSSSSSAWVRRYLLSLPLIVLLHLPGA